MQAEFSKKKLFFKKMQKTIDSHAVPCYTETTSIRFSTKRAFKKIAQQTISSGDRRCLGISRKGLPMGRECGSGRTGAEDEGN
jgi:hypothetical protein